MPFTLTAARLDAFIVYQTDRVRVQRELGKRSVGRGAARSDGGVDREQVGRLRARAAQEEELRLRSGMSYDELERISEMVEDVLEERRGLTDAGEETIARMKHLVASLPTSERGELEAATRELEAKQQAAKALKSARQRHGDAAVNLILSREKELRRLLSTQWGM